MNELGLSPRQQQGSITILALIFTVVVGILLAGLLPFTTHVGISSAADVKTLAAQYAAEAGIKRAYISIENDFDDWQWADGGEISTVNATNAPKYKVTIDPPIPNGTKPVIGTNYTIKAIGIAGGVTRQVNLTVKVENVEVLKEVTKEVTVKKEKQTEENILINIPDYALYINGDFSGAESNKVTLNGNIKVGGDFEVKNGATLNGRIEIVGDFVTKNNTDFNGTSVAIGGDLVVGPGTNSNFNVPVNVKGGYYSDNGNKKESLSNPKVTTNANVSIEPPQKLLPSLDATTFKNAAGTNTLPNPSSLKNNQNQNLTENLYYYKGDYNISDTVTFKATPATGNTIIYIDGNLTISKKASSVKFQPSGSGDNAHNIMIIVNGDVTWENNNGLLQGILIAKNVYLNGNNFDMNGGSIMADEEVHVGKNSPNFNQDTARTNSFNQQLNQVYTKTEIVEETEMVTEIVKENVRQVSIGKWSHGKVD